MIKEDIIKTFVTFDQDYERCYSKLSSCIENTCILVIGGAGTIGSNYIKQLLRFKPSRITVVDTNENSLAELTRDLRSSNLLDYSPEFTTYPVDLSSEVFDKVFHSGTWDIVANFAAHKHVRSEKDKISVEALVRNNVFGAIKLLELCEKRPPCYFFSVSTDKAANPVNLMGASKSLMEKLILSRKNAFRVSTARFANVAFSNGSLLDGFVKRIEQKQPLSCPEDIKRFFVTPRQSGQICLLSTFLESSGSIFFPKLDSLKHQISFRQIALDFLVRNGWEPEIFIKESDAKQFDYQKNPGRYPIYFFKTDTSGEKKYEEFFTEKEDYNIDVYDSLGFINPPNMQICFDDVISSFENVFNSLTSNKSDIVDVIRKYVPDLNHIETGRSLDQKM